MDQTEMVKRDYPKGLPVVLDRDGKALMMLYTKETPDKKDCAFMGQGWLFLQGECGKNTEFVKEFEALWGKHFNV